MFPAVLYFIVAAAVLVYIIHDFRERIPRGGKGPRVGRIPRSLRPMLNHHFERRGWPKPFDDEGNRIIP